jgi:protein-tyrosine phosphatase
MYRILFVCTGNICRSPTAEAIFRHKARAKGFGEHFEVDSAGTHGYHVGDAPDHRTIATAMAQGVDMHDLRARKLQAKDFSEYDLILALDEEHHAHITRLCPKDARAEVKLFLDYLETHTGQGVPDPYYGGQADFDHVYDLVDRGAEALLNFLIQRP